MRRILILAGIAIFAYFLTSCLTVEKKQYTFEFTGKNSGKLTIKYINIMSIVDSAGVTEKEDFEALINDYSKGNKIESSYPDASNITKRLFEENGVLCAEVSMDFSDVKAARLAQLDKKSPYVFYTSSVDGETYVESNGTYGGDHCPVVFFSPKLKKLTVTTSVSSPSDETYVSLVKEYRRYMRK